MKRIKRIFAFMVLDMPITIFDRLYREVVWTINSYASIVISNKQPYCNLSDVDVKRSNLSNNLSVPLFSQNLIILN